MSGRLKKEALKKAVYQAIRLIRTEEQAQADYLFWLESFDKENKFSLIRFVQSFSEQHHLNSEEKMLLRNSLRNSLFTIKNNDVSEATSPPNRPPLPIINEAEIEPTVPRNTYPIAAAKNDFLDPNDSNQSTFEALLNELFSHSDKQGVERSMLIESLKYFLKDSILPINTQSQFINWCLGELPSGIERVATMKEKSAVIHNVYNALCEELGPVEADKILSYSVDKIKLLPCAEQVSPESFL